MIGGHDRIAPIRPVVLYHRAGSSKFSPRVCDDRCVHLALEGIAAARGDCSLRMAEPSEEQRDSLGDASLSM